MVVEKPELFKHVQQPLNSFISEFKERKGKLANKEEGEAQKKRLGYLLGAIEL